MVVVGKWGIDCLKIDFWYFLIVINIFMKNF